jgi:hypothetical protein
MWLLGGFPSRTAGGHTGAAGAADAGTQGDRSAHRRHRRHHPGNGTELINAGADLLAVIHGVFGQPISRRRRRRMPHFSPFLIEPC